MPGSTAGSAGRYSFLASNDPPGPVSKIALQAPGRFVERAHGRHAVRGIRPALHCLIVDPPAEQVDHALSAFGEWGAGHAGRYHRVTL